MLAALASIFTPVFLVSSTTVMCDVPMLALWVWAVALWVEGTERETLCRLVCAAVIIALAILTKYYAAVLIPLLTAYSLITKRRLGWWCVCLAIPLTALCGYGWATLELYGKALPLSAIEYAKLPHDLFALIAALATALLILRGRRASVLPDQRATA